MNMRTQINTAVTYGHDIDIKDEEMKNHGKTDGAHQPLVNPRRHDRQRLILTQAENVPSWLHGSYLPTY